MCKIFHKQYTHISDYWAHTGMYEQLQGTDFLQSGLWRGSGGKVASFTSNMTDIITHMGDECKKKKSSYLSHIL